VLVGIAAGLSTESRAARGAVELALGVRELSGLPVTSMLLSNDEPERDDDRRGDHGVVDEVQHTIGHAQRGIADAGARTAVVHQHPGDDHEMLDLVPRLQANGPDDVYEIGPPPNDGWARGPDRSQQNPKRCQEDQVEEQMQPLLGPLELEDVPEQPKSLVIGDVPDHDLNQLQDVLEHVHALDHDDNNEEREQPRLQDAVRS